MSSLLSIRDGIVTYHNNLNKKLECLRWLAFCPPDVRKVKSQAQSAINERICAPGRCFLRPLFKWDPSRPFQAQAGLSTNHDVCADVELTSILAETTQWSRVRVPGLAHQSSRHYLHERTKRYLKGLGDDFLP